MLLDEVLGKVKDAEKWAQLLAADLREVLGGPPVTRRGFLGKTAAAIGLTLLGSSVSAETLVAYLKEYKKTPAETYDILCKDWIKQFKVTPEKYLASKDPNGPLVILLRDWHTNDEKEGAFADLMQLEFFHDFFGITLIGVEGWGGPEADRYFGYRKLCGQDDMIVRLLDEKRYQEKFTVVGLEDPPIDVLSDKYSCVRYYILMKDAKGFPKIEKDYMDLILIFLKDLRMKYSEGLMQKFSKEINDRLGFDLAKNFEKRGEEAHKLLRMTLREKAAVKKAMMRLKKEKIVLVVYGSGHVDSLTAMFHARGCHVIVVR